MRILVVSDTHGDYKSLAATLKLLGRSVGAVVHLGDGSGDMRSAAHTGVPMPPSYCIRGNVDSDTSFPLIRRIDAEGKTIIAAHGHRYPLGQGVSCLVRAAKEEGARAFLFGHTHIPYMEDRNGVLVLNPGSLSRPRGQWGPSLAIIEVSSSSDSMEVKFYELIGSYASPRLKAIHI